MRPACSEEEEVVLLPFGDETGGLHAASRVDRKHNRLHRIIVLLGAFAVCAGTYFFMSKSGHHGSLDQSKPDEVIDEFWQFALPAAVADLAVPVAVTGTVAVSLPAVATIGLCVLGTVYVASVVHHWDDHGGAVSSRRLLEQYDHPVMCYPKAGVGMCCHDGVRELHCSKNECKFQKEDLPACKSHQAEDVSSWFCVAWHSNGETTGRLFNKQKAANNFFVSLSSEGNAETIYCNKSGVMSTSGPYLAHQTREDKWKEMSDWCKGHRKTTPSSDLSECYVKQDTAQCSCSWIDDVEKCSESGGDCYDACKRANPECFCQQPLAIDGGAPTYCPRKQDAPQCGCWWIDDVEKCSGSDGECYDECRRVNPECFCPSS